MMEGTVLVGPGDGCRWTRWGGFAKVSGRSQAEQLRVRETVVEVS